jgi:methionyl-tRNA formyltransferase
MRIALMGQAAFGASSLEALLKNDEEIVVVYTPPDSPGGKEDPLAALAREKDLPLMQPPSYTDADVIPPFQAFSPDLLIMAFVTAILPKDFLDVPTHGSICYHPSILPRHRGASGINWAIIMGDKETGLTIFWTDGGIDTGPILLQKKLPIGPEDTTGTLYFKHLFPMGVEAIVESVGMIKAGNAPRIPQDESVATYEPPCNDKVAKIDWARPGEEIYNLIRGCDPQPGAYCTCKGEKIRFYGARFHPDRSEGPSGEILGLEEDRLIVSTGTGALEISKVRTPDLGKVEASKFAVDSGVKTGDRFQ